MSGLLPFAEDVWIAQQPHAMLGLHLGTRMTVVRQPDCGLWVHSPVALTPELPRTLAELGPVAHIVAPNAFHHVYAGPWKQACPAVREILGWDFDRVVVAHGDSVTRDAHAVTERGMARLVG